MRVAKRLPRCPFVDRAAPGDPNDEQSGAQEEKENPAPVDTIPFVLEFTLNGLQLHEQGYQD